MEKKRVVPVWVTVILLVLLACSIAYHGFLLVTAPPMYLFVTMYLLGIVVDLSALLYCLTQYKKNSAVFFRAFVICLYLIIAFYVYNRAQIISFPCGELGFVFAMIDFAMLSVFVFAKDIGKKRSLVYASIAMLAELADTCLTFATSGVELGLSGLGCCVSYLVFVLLVYAKYKDKDARGAM